MAMLVRAFAGQNVSVDSGSEASGHLYGSRRFARHAAQLIGENGKLEVDIDTLRVVARLTLIDALSARTNRSDSGVVVRIAGDAIGADADLPNMGKEEFLACLTRRLWKRAAAARVSFPARASGTPALPLSSTSRKNVSCIRQPFSHPMTRSPPGDRSFRPKTPHAGPRSESLRKLSRCALNKRKFNEGRKAFRSSREVCWRGSLLTVD
ncbi:hypothetical protein HFO62_33145 [Rhizobium leguminosarum]|nr:hypothetical protein [Rhizobium leguminosarum]